MLRRFVFLVKFLKIQHIIPNILVKKVINFFQKINRSCSQDYLHVYSEVMAGILSPLKGNNHGCIMNTRTSTPCSWYFKNYTNITQTNKNENNVISGGRDRMENVKVIVNVQILSNWWNIE